MNTTIDHKRRCVSGFTLIEIMVVVVIIGLLAAIIAPNLIGQLDRAESTAARAEIRTIASALDLFRLANYQYPTEDQGLEILLGNGEIDGRPVEKLLMSTPNDPWDRPYIYEIPGTHGDTFDVYTLGADGEEGGEGVNADIGTWNLE